MGVHCFAHILFYDLSNVALNSERGIRYTVVEFFPDITILLSSNFSVLSKTGNCVCFSHNISPLQNYP